MLTYFYINFASYTVHVGMWLKEYSTLDISYSALLTPLYTYNRGFTYLFLHAISSGKRCLGTFLNAHSSRGNLVSNASLNLHSILPIAQVGSRLKACLSVSRVTSSLREGASFKWNVGFCARGEVALCSRERNDSWRRKR